MFSKSLIQFSVDGKVCVPSLLLDLRPNYGGGHEVMETSFRRSHTHTAMLSVATAAGHCGPTALLEIPRHLRASLGQSLWGHCSFLLAPGVHSILFVPSKSLFPQSCVSSGGSQFSSVHFSRSVVSDSLRPHESQHARPPCPSPTPGVHSDSRPSSQ